MIGILPGLFAMTVVGSQLASLLRAEDLGTVAWTVVAITVALGAIALLRRMAGPRERELE